MGSVSKKAYYGRNPEYAAMKIVGNIGVGGGDVLFPADLQHTVTNKIGGFQIGESLAGMNQNSILEKLLCIEPDNSPQQEELPTMIGLIDFKDISTITYDDLNVDTVVKGIVRKPQAVYDHGSEVALAKASVIAFPKSFGQITEVVDGAGISITASYHWIDTVLTIPGKGEVPYVIGGPKKPQIYNNSTVVRWNIT